MNRLQIVNKYFSRCFDKSTTFTSAYKTSDIDQEVYKLITSVIPAEIASYLNDDNYLVCALCVPRGQVTDMLM